jgi:hypothetical protein
MQASEIRTKTAGMMPGLLVDLERLVVHLGTMRLFDGKPPWTVKLILEGMEGHTATSGSCGETQRGVPGPRRTPSTLACQ